MEQTLSHQGTGETPLHLGRSNKKKTAIPRQEQKHFQGPELQLRERWEHSHKKFD